MCRCLQWFAPFCLALLAVVFAPLYHKSGVSTLPEYLERRFSKGSRTFLAVTGIVGALLIHIGMALHAGALMFQSFFDLDPFLGLVLVLVLTSIYTLAGGLRAVVYTEVVQVFILLLGTTIVSYSAWGELQAQGIGTLEELRQNTTNTTSGVDRMSMVQWDGDYRFYYLLLGYPVLGTWYWCTDQTIVQRVLGAKQLSDAQIGPIFAGFIKILPVPLFVLPGVMASVLYKDQVTVPDMAMFVLIKNLVTAPGLKGLICAAMLSALMSTVAGALNSVATLVSVDICKQLKPSTSDSGLVLIGRVTATLVLLLSVGWSTQISKMGNVFEAVNATLACLSPPISAVFVLGALWPRGTQQACLATLVVGFATGTLVFVLDFRSKLFTETLGIRKNSYGPL